MAVPQSASSKMSVLLVEDSRVDAAIVSAMLNNKADMKITHVMKFQDALNALMDHSFDAVLLDLNLPDADSFVSIGTLSEFFPGVPLVILSGDNEEVARLQEAQEGGDAFMVKEMVNDNAIHDKILEAIQNRKRRNK